MVKAKVVLLLNNMWSELGNLIWPRHLCRSTVVANLKFICKNYNFSFTRAQRGLSYHHNYDMFAKF